MSNVAPPPGRLGFIDALRGAGALVVVFAHSGSHDVSWLPLFDPVMLVAKAAIVVFFLASGFFLPVSFEREGSLAQFWVRRLFRLFPAYWFCIACAFLIFCLGVPLSSSSGNLSAGDWLLNLTMTQEFFRRESLLYVFWTLPLELTIYFVFTCLFALRLHRRSAWLVAAMLGTIAVIGAVRLAGGQSFGLGGKRFYYFAPVMGLLVYRWLEGRASAVPMWILGVGQFGLLFVAWFADKALGRAEPHADLSLMVTLFIWSVGYGAFFLALANRHRSMPSALVWVGRISYSLYLLHILVQSLLVPLGWPAWAHVPVLFAGSLALADASYRWIELPCISLGRSLERRWLPVGNAEAGTPRPARRAA